MINYSKIQMISAASSNKVILEGNGTFTIPALGGAGETFSYATIPHNQNNDNLMFQVTATQSVNNVGIIPWQSSDGRVTLYAQIDNINLYIYGISSDSGGSGNPARTISFNYRILIP